MKILKYAGVIIGSLILGCNVNASEKELNVNLESLTYSENAKDYLTIKTYKTLEDFLKAYKANKLPDIYITNFLFDGVSSVKSPDLDDFIELGSNDAKIKELEIRVININTTGDIEFTGETIGSMIAVNTNDVSGNINLILNNVSIDTDSKKSPAIYVYNKETTYTGCKVTIKTTDGSKNYIEGGKLKKVSLVGSDELENYSKNYSGENLTNYNKYTSYYGIYTSEEIKNILFATVKADNEDLQEGDPSVFYKASGAISADIDLYFDGTGYLNVKSKNKEGIETKGNLTFTGGTGDYEIHAQDDCLNTTTASNNGSNVRNNMIIDVNSLLAVVNDEGDEGDAIDSNGTLTINGGKIYAFAHSNSQDSGLDSNNGIYINGGTIIATGNMADEISEQSKQNTIYLNLKEKVEAGTLLVIKDENDNIITAFETTKDITTLLYSTEDLDYKSYKVYKNGNIDGEETNGLYTIVNNYTNGEEVSYSSVSINNKIINNNNYLLKYLLIEASLLFIVLIYAFIDNKNAAKKYA